MTNAAFGNKDEETERVKLRFPGQYYDEERKTYYNYFRDYNPSTGRYQTSDPIGLAGGMNTYRYAENNINNNIDILGLKTCGSGWSDIVVPDYPGGYMFSDCCVGHDDCYGQCNGPTKESCDNIFLNCMTNMCDKSFFFIFYKEKQRCYLTAGLYFAGVSEFGQKPFDNAREGCISCEN